MPSMYALMFLLLLSASFITCLQYTNPITADLNLPDPGVFYSGASDSYFVVTTRTTSDRIPIYQSRDLVNWKHVGQVFHSVVPWISTDKPSYWAPEIHKVGSRHVIVYAGRAQDGLMCIGLAVSSNVTGPYRDLGHPLVRPITDQGEKVGAIDPTLWTDPSTKKTYLIWKRAYNSVVALRGHLTPIMAQQIDTTTFALLGSPSVLLQNNRSSWEGPVAEAPSLISYGKFTYMFYSGNWFDQDKYAVGVARSANGIKGPWRKMKSNPLLKKNVHWAGPGHCSIARIRNTGDFFLIYHAYKAGQVGGARLLMMDTVVFDPVTHWPRMKASSAPTWTAQQVGQPMLKAEASDPSSSSSHSFPAWAVALVVIGAVVAAIVIVVVIVVVWKRKHTSASAHEALLN